MTKKFSRIQVQLEMSFSPRQNRFYIQTCHLLLLKINASGIASSAGELKLTKCLEHLMLNSQAPTQYAISMKYPFSEVGFLRIDISVMIPLN